MATELTPEYLASLTYVQLLTLPIEALDAIGAALIEPDSGKYLSPFVLGLFLDCMLGGIVFMQAGHWFSNCHAQETWIVRALVYWVLLLAVIVTVFLIVWYFRMFVYNYGRYFQFLQLDFASYFYLIDAMTRFPVSAFFGHRAWKMSHQNIFVAIIIAVLLVASGALGLTAKVLSETLYGETTFINIVCIWLGCHLASDVLCTGVIGVNLIKSKTGWKHTDKLVGQLLLMTAESQLPPTIMSLAFLIVYVTDKSSSWPIFFVFSGKVFALCLLTVLNTKFKLRSEMESGSASREHNTYPLKSRTRNPTQIHVLTESFRERDDSYNQLADGKKDDFDLESNPGTPRKQDLRNQNPSLSELQYDNEGPVNVRFQ